jgi:hypothetical protein
MLNNYFSWLIKYSTILSFFFTFLVNAQTVTLQGIVSDSLKTPLVYATLLAKPTDSNETTPYAITDKDGIFALDLKKGITYSISVSSLGFKTYNFTHVADKDSAKNIELLEDITQLNEVIIELPITVKKDTITYRIDKFITGEERKLKDVLKKLPGIEVDDDGVVTSRGKKVTHLLVENKSFFGGNSKLGVENIPANSIDEVEVIDDYNEISFLKGMTRTDNMAMNIKLKENKKNFVFGDIESGTGDNYHYKSHANLFYYHPKLNLNFIGGFNNIGARTLTSKDYQTFIGGPSSVFNSRDFYQEKNIISQDLETKDVLKSENKVAALNFTKTLQDKIELSSYLILSDNNNESKIETLNQYILTNLNYTENLSNNIINTQGLGIGKLNFKYTPNKFEEWSLNILAKRNNNLNNTSTLSIVDTTVISVKKDRNGKTDYSSINLEWHKKTSKKHAFSLNSNLLYTANDANALWNTNQPISEGLIPFTQQDIYMLRLLRNIKKTDFTSLFKYYYTTDKFNLLHITLGNQYKEHHFFTDDSQLLEDQTLNSFDNNGFGNDLNFKLNDFYLGLYYNFRTGKFEFQQSLFLHNYTWKINQTNSTNKNKWVLLPEFTISSGSSSSKGFLKFESRLESPFSDVSNLASNFYLQSYNSVNIGNENLENELNHFSSLTYSRSNLLKGIYMLGVINYSHKIDGVVNSVSTNNLDRVFSKNMLHKPNKNFSGTLVVRKNRKNFGYNLTTRFLSTKSIQLLDGSPSEFRSTIGSYKLSLSTSYIKFPNIEIGFKQSLGEYKSNNSANNFTINEPFFNIEYDFFKNFLFSFDYRHYNYENKTIELTNSYSISNSSLSFQKENSAWGFKISGQNLFDVAFKNQNSLNVYVISETKTFVLPRIIMLSLIYKL